MIGFIIEFVLGGWFGFALAAVLVMAKDTCRRHEKGGERMISCGQACPYNTLNGCKVKEYNGICPLTNMALADMEAVKVAKPQTNADRIRAMRDEELAELLCTDHCVQIRGNNKLCDGTCLDCVADWLRQPVKGGDNDGE